jgi:hypothetical protein
MRTLPASPLLLLAQTQAKVGLQSFPQAGKCICSKEVVAEATKQAGGAAAQLVAFLKNCGIPYAGAGC